MAAGLPPLPDGPPIPDVIYTPEEAIAWIRTMTTDGLVTAARRDPERFPSRKTGRWVGFSGEDILAIIAATKRTPTAPAEKPPMRRTRRRVSAPAAAPELPPGVAPLVAKPRERGRRAS